MSVGSPLNKRLATDDFLLPSGAVASVATVLRIYIASFIFSGDKSALDMAVVNFAIALAMS